MSVRRTGHPLYTTVDGVTIADVGATHTGDVVDPTPLVVAGGGTAASAVTFTPTGTVAATNVQTAVAEVATDAASALTTGLATKANRATRPGALSGFGPCAGRQPWDWGGFGSGTVTTDATSTATVTFRHKVPVHRASDLLRLVFENTGSGGTPNTNQITVSATIEAGQNAAGSLTTNIALVRVTFRGDTSAVLAGGATAPSDPIGATLVTSGFLWMRVRVTVPSVGDKYPGNTFSNQTGEGYLAGDQTSVAVGTAFTTVGGSQAYTVYVLAASAGASAALAGVAVLGDSLAAGLSDSAVTDGGLILRGLNAASPKVGAVTQAVSGLSFLKWNRADQVGRAESQYAKDYALAKWSGGCPWVICELGLNDVVGDSGADPQAVANLATMQSRAQETWAMLRRLGFLVCQTTLTPVSTGTFTSAAGQTTSPTNPVRTGFNDYVRAGAGGFIDAYIEIADVLETSRNSGIWVSPSGVAQTGDGIHGNAAGYALGAGAVTTAVNAGLLA